MVTIQHLHTSNFRLSSHHMQRCLDGTQTLRTALHETGFQISITHLLLGPAQREAGIWKLLLHESKDMALDTVSLSRFKKQRHNTVVTFHIYLLQRTAYVHKVKSLLATKRATFKLPAGNSGWPVPPRALIGKVLAGPQLRHSLYHILQYE